MSAEEEVDMSAVFSTKKKKKSTKVKTDTTDELVEAVSNVEISADSSEAKSGGGAAAADDDGEVDVTAMFGEKKKKKKSTKKKGDDAEDSSVLSGAPSAAEVPPSYTYAQLLQRVYDLLQENNPDMIEKKRGTLKPPQLMKVGTKKTLWVNYHEICQMMNRSDDHVKQFMEAELGTEGSIDGMQRLLIKGKFVPKYIESLLRKYIGEYVTCQMCRSFKTTLTKDSVSRLFFVHCQDCGSSRSVAHIRGGYHAQTRADRKALRNA